MPQLPQATTRCHCRRAVPRTHLRGAPERLLLPPGRSVGRHPKTQPPGRTRGHFQARPVAYGSEIGATTGPSARFGSGTSGWSLPPPLGGLYCRVLLIPLPPDLSSPVWILPDPSQFTSGGAGVGRLPPPPTPIRPLPRLRRGGMRAFANPFRKTAFSVFLQENGCLLALRVQETAEPFLLFIYLFFAHRRSVSAWFSTPVAKCLSEQSVASTRPVT